MHVSASLERIWRWYGDHVRRLLHCIAGSNTRWRHQVRLVKNDHLSSTNTLSPLLPALCLSRHPSVSGSTQRVGGVSEIGCEQGSQRWTHSPSQRFASAL